MNVFTLLALTAFAAYLLKSREQKRRIALLGSYLGQYQIEKIMESLTEGYLRALGEDNPERSAQIWSMLATSEVALGEQFNRFAADFAKVDEADARVSKFAWALPYANKLFPDSTFDLRKAFHIHAQGIRDAVENRQNQSQKGKAYTLSAELFLMQHTCHWYCRSKSVASARMVTLHKTPYAQLVGAVAPDTRKAYSALLAS